MPSSTLNTFHLIFWLVSSALYTKVKSKDPFNCHSFRGITRTSVILKTFEYLLLERICPILQANGHPLLMQTAYQKHNSCQDAIFATQEAILKVVREGGDAFLSLFNLEKAYDSLEHDVLLDSLFDAGIKGRAWRIISCCTITSMLL